MKLKSMRDRALDVAQDALDGSQVLLARVVHVKTHLLDGVRDVRAREGEVLQSPGEAPILSRVGDGSTGGGGELRRRVNRRRRGLACSHAGFVQNLRGVLGLREVHAGGVAGDRDAEEVVKAAHVRHGELGAERGGDPVKETRRGGGEDDVVDVQQKIGRTLCTLENKQ